MVRPSGSKHWHMSYRIDGKEKKLSFGPYHDDPERGVTLAEARVKRDIAKKAISQGIDPNAAKKAAKLDRATKVTFGQKADDFLAKQKAEGLGEKSITRTERMVRYLKADFGKLPYDDAARQEFRPELLAFLKKNTRRPESWKRSIGCAPLPNRFSTMAIAMAPASIRREICTNN
jgi:hypothetical protein